MRHLLDTHILLWLMCEPHKIKEDICICLKSDHNELFVSSVSLWEILVKASLGKYLLPESFLDDVLRSNVQILDIAIAALRAIQHLPYHHKDPFDRMIIAQAITEKLTLVTHDVNLTAYDAKIILA